MLDRVERMVRATMRRLDAVNWRAAGGNVWLLGVAVNVFLSVMLLFFIIAEARQFGQWRHANAKSRGLWQATAEDPSWCFHLPMFEYTLQAILSVLWSILGL
ncbi:hypothetical protein F5Y15DRAFT_370542 [Xylariaceae sp. FL0016]|nr:hypothetical protein F5Y15DRAFT_370542 [Xylariaceae sp. FL0016]